MRSIFHLILLGIGFFLGIYIGVHNPQLGGKLDTMRAQQQQNIQPMIDAAVSKAKIDLLQRFVDDTKAAGQSASSGGSSLIPGSSGFVGGPSNSSAAVSSLQTNYQKMLDDEKAKAATLPH